MNKSQLQELIRLEVQNVVKSELKKIVKPLVQEAVAGALANLLAEGIVKGAPAQKPAILRPDVPQAKVNKPQARQGAAKTSLDEGTRRRLAAQMGYDRIEPIGRTATPNFGTSNDIVSNILAETAAEMESFSKDDTPSVLDDIDGMAGSVSPDAVDAISRDYSALMERLNQKGRGKLNG